MTVNNYRLGSIATLTCRFYSDAAKTILADPTTVGLTVRDPTGTVTILSPVVNAGVGIRTYDFPTAIRGMHDIRWVGAGAVVSADQDSIFVLEDFTLGADLTTVANVKTAIGVQASSSDALIQDLISAASRAIATRYQREFYPVGTATRRFRVDNLRVDLAPFDLRSATTVTLNPEATSPTVLVAGTDYDLKPVNAGLLGTYTELQLSRYLSVNSTSLQAFSYANLDILGTWGAAAIPADVARACIVTVTAWLDRGADVIAGMDSTVRNDSSTMSASWAIPAAAYRLLQPYERVSWYVA